VYLIGTIYKFRSPDGGRGEWCVCVGVGEGGVDGLRSGGTNAIQTGVCVCVFRAGANVRTYIFFGPAQVGFLRFETF
jgi:hypothetical protein